ncbi:GNAT family N-acetyltransferase [Pseudodesulfovibrio sp. zrk46]|uniref:GNAT family N-acetyltransferase n=1 Tax=Pseudodesulfovibrio sp. zrk46 TaxID=2725288 RepID=UPI0014490A69|nr:GNAT family N-acetyltransferase [Pseudodesulfovibrio sp. zrk46]QJB55195.1 GNAT family N-acetyltransferase [Pseudodesulfovibrio sp. zrk46]
MLLPELVVGGTERLDDIRPMWEALNKLHAQVAPHFRLDFECYEFKDRKAYLQSKATLGELRIFLIRLKGKFIGYCVASLGNDFHGEIESIYVDELYRSMKMGDTLMRAALDWMDENGAITKSINVVYGNEAAFSFYEKYGFYPRSTTLLQR